MSLCIKAKKSLKNFDINLDFKIDSGILGILGKSGSGKSMTLGMIAGIEIPDTGTIKFGDEIIFDSGKKINIKPRYRKVGYLFQNYALFPNMTVYENIRICSKNQNADFIHSELVKYDIEKIKNQYPFEISGGESQRVALCRMLITDPDIILLDEPFSALDINMKLKMQNQLLKYLKDFRGIGIIVSHDKDEIYRFCNNVCLIDKGNIIDFGQKERIFSRPKNIQAAKIIGIYNTSDVETNNNILISSKWGIEFHLESNIINKVSSIAISDKAFSLDEKSNYIIMKINNISYDTENIILVSGNKDDFIVRIPKKINLDNYIYDNCINLYFDINELYMY